MLVFDLVLVLYFVFSKIPAKRETLTSKFTERIHRAEKHHTDNDKVDEQRSRTTGVEGASGADEETSTNGTTDGNHLHVPALELAVQLALLAHLDVDIGRDDALRRRIAIVLLLRIHHLVCCARVSRW